MAGGVCTESTLPGNRHLPPMKRTFEGGDVRSQEGTYQLHNEVQRNISQRMPIVINLHNLNDVNKGFAAPVPGGWQDV